MEKEEIFRVFNACQPTVAQVREYLEKIASDSPFDLIFRKDGKEYFSKKITPNMGELVGIVVDKTIFYAQPMTYADVQKLDTVNTRTVFDFAKSIHPLAAPINMKAFTLLKDYQKDFRELSEKLEVLGYPKIYKQQSYLLFEKASDAEMTSVYCFKHGFSGSCSIEFHLRMSGNIYFYASIQ